VVAWVGNRLWTFRHRRRSALHHEFLLFMAMNGVGLAITAGCVGISHYWLGFTSVLADNVAKNLVGVGFASVFRFWAYRRFVFSEVRAAQPVAPRPTLPDPDRLTA
jgi:putative flippase GtrA